VAFLLLHIEEVVFTDPKRVIKELKALLKFSGIDYRIST
jgi:hypothetical protein